METEHSGANSFLRVCMWDACILTSRFIQVVKKPAAEKKAATTKKATPEKSPPAAAKKEASPKPKVAVPSPKKGTTASSSPKAAAVNSKDGVCSENHGYWANISCIDENIWQHAMHWETR